jgi:Cu+-exporting ATPase
VGQYGYLGVIAVTAVAVGVGLTAASRTDTAGRGMNGLLAWTEAVGMPMRPSMSTMMTAEIQTMDAHEAGLEVHVGVPSNARPGMPTRVLVHVTDATTGKAFTHLGRSHEVWAHLIATRSDLGTFAHVHPEPTGRPGELEVEMTFPTAGRYIINTEFRRRGDMGDLHARQTIRIGGPVEAPAPVRPTPRVVVIDGVRVELTGDAHAGETSDLTFTFTDAGNGKALDNFQPYLAAAGHVVIMRADGTTFSHEHADVRDSDGDPVFALPGQTFGPTMPVHAEFDTPGTYRLWGQFRLASGKVLTVPFTLDAR